MEQRLKVIVVLMTVCVSIFSQTKISDRQSLIGATATIAPGRLLVQGENTTYVHGKFEGFAASNISIRLDGYYYLGTQQESSIFQNSGVLAGVAYHFIKEGPLDPYIALQPGMSVVEMNDGTFYSGESFTPVISTELGVQYFIGRFFNVFGSVRYLYGNAQFPTPYNSSLSEIRASFGLGFNFISADKCGTCPHW